MVSTLACLLRTKVRGTTARYCLSNNRVLVCFPTVQERGAEISQWHPDQSATAAVLLARISFPLSPSTPQLVVEFLGAAYRE